MNKITKDMTFGEVMQKDSEVAFKLMEMGLMCGGCPIAQFETIEDGCIAHGADVNEVLKKLNKDETKDKSNKRKVNKKKTKDKTQKKKVNKKGSKDKINKKKVDKKK